MPVDQKRPMRGRYTALISASIAISLMDRIDLLGGRGSFKLVPWLVLAPLLIGLAALVSLHRPGQLCAAPSRAKGALGAILILLFTTLLSVLVSGQTSKGVERWFLFVVLIFSGWSLILLVRWTENYRAVRIGSVLGLVSYALFDLLQVRYYHQYGITGPAMRGMLDTTVVPFGHGVIRLTGGSGDANRAAMAIAVFVYLIAADPLVRTPRRTVGIAALVAGVVMGGLTLSRSGVAVLMIVLMAAIVGIIRNSNGFQRLVEIAGLVVVGGWLAMGEAVKLFGGQKVVNERLTMSDGSTETHVSLLSRGVDLGTADWRMFVGHGFGESFVHLQDVFPGNAYANFHSLFVTVLVESGIVALAAACFLLLGPVMSGRRRSLALGLVVFNVFYQSLSDPIFWVVVAVLWALPDTPRTAVGDAQELDPRPEPVPAVV